MASDSSQLNAADDKVQPLDAERFALAEHHWRTFSATFPAGTQPDDLQRPEVWQRIAPQVREWDHIWARCELGSWIAHLLVVSKGAEGLGVLPLGGHRLGGVGAQEPMPVDLSGFDVIHKGVHEKWCVQEKNGRTLKTKLATRGDAVAWLRDYVKALKK